MGEGKVVKETAMKQIDNVLVLTVLTYSCGANDKLYPICKNVIIKAFT